MSNKQSVRRVKGALGNPFRYEDLKKMVAVTQVCLRQPKDSYAEGSSLLRLADEYLNQGIELKFETVGHISDHCPTCGSEE